LAEVLFTLDFPASIVPRLLNLRLTGKTAVLSRGFHMGVVYGQEIEEHEEKSECKKRAYFIRHLNPPLIGFKLLIGILLYKLMTFKFL
jgi:hypothetical protein